MILSVNKKDFQFERLAAILQSCQHTVEVGSMNMDGFWKVNKVVELK